MSVGKGGSIRRHDQDLEPHHHPEGFPVSQGLLRWEFHKYLLKAYCVPGPALDTGDSTCLKFEFWCRRALSLRNPRPGFHYGAPQ